MLMSKLLKRLPNKKELPPLQVLKALIAKNIFGTKYYYQIMKEVDPCYKKAFEVLL